MNDPVTGESHYKKMANQLNNLDFPEVIKLVEMIEDGKYEVLPWIKRVYSNLLTVNPHNLCRCCRTEKLILPQCANINNSTLVNLPYVKSLTINSINQLTGDVFYHLNYLKELQILSHRSDQPDELLDNKTVKHMKELQYLHVYNNILVDDDFHHMKELRVIVIDSDNPRLTPNILNHLPNAEVCIINKVLHKYTDSTRNNSIIKRIGKLVKIKIYAVKNN